jgi:hypothetical protein
VRDSERVGDDNEEGAASFDGMKEKGEIMEWRAPDLERKKQTNKQTNKQRDVRND